MLIVKLSALLRRLLRSQDHFVTLRDELEAVDEYLDIERVRFGPRLVVDKEIAADTLDRVVPSMLLQPLVENSIKHGLAGKVDTGRILLKSTRQGGVVVIEVVDNGVGIPADRLAGVMDRGIGLRNVNERLRVIYGDSCQLRLHSVAGVGTSVRLEVPDITLPERISA
jgi:two-component system LytT family sensor kinase